MSTLNEIMDECWGLKDTLKELRIKYRAALNQLQEHSSNEYFYHGDKKYHVENELQSNDKSITEGE